MLRAIRAASEAKLARSHVGARCRRREYLAAFDCAFEFPRPSIAAMKRRLHRPGGYGYEHIRRALESTLTALWNFWRQAERDPILAPFGSGAG
jgi:hypothetical protein